MIIAAADALRDFVDPFGSSADPARYVPRAATEAALEALVRAVRDESCSALLYGVPGIGKTLMLRLLARRLEPELRAIHLPYASLPLAALCAWALQELDAPASYDPVGALLAQARFPRDETCGLVLLIDDIEVMPEDTARELVRLTGASEGTLRFVAAADRLAAAPLADVFGDVFTVNLTEPMNAEETARYVGIHLERPGLDPAAIEAFDPGTLGMLHARAGGVPGRVNAEAAAVLLEALASPRHAPPLAPEPAPTAQRAASELPPAQVEHAASLERAAGRLVLAHRGAAPGIGGAGHSASFERAVGRLAVAEAEATPDGVVLARAGDAPRTPTPRQPELPAAVARRPRLRLTTPLVVFAVFFAVGVGAGVWLGRGVLEPPVASTPGAAIEAEAQPPAPAPEPQPIAPPVTPPAVVVDVQINAAPWASIRVDGEQVGITPLAGVRLEAGPHRFEARFPDGRVVERVIEIDSTNRFVVFR